MFHKLLRWLKTKLPNRLKEKIKNILGVGSRTHDVNVFTRIETDSNKINIAIYTGGGLGDFIVYKKIIDNLLKHANCHLYLLTLSYDNAQIILGETSNMEIYYSLTLIESEQFDLIFDIDHYINVRSFNASSLKIKSPKLYEMACKIILYNKENIITTENIRAQRLVIIQRAKYLGLNRWTQLSCNGVFDMSSMRSGITINNNKMDIVLSANDLYGKKYITISFGADIDMGGIRQTKVWPLTRYSEFLLLFKKIYPDVITVQLATKFQPKISNIDIFIKNASYDDVKIILTHSQFHLSNEGGLVHTATQIGTKCVVVFGATPVHYYGYPDNINIVSPVCTGCMETTERWFEKCPKGFENVECMIGITAEMVIDAIEKSNLTNR